MDLSTRAAQWRRAVQQPANWEPAVRQIGARAGLSWDSVLSDFHSNNAVFMLDERYVVKWYAPDQRASYEVEAEALRLLAYEPSLPVPPLLARGILADGLAGPYIVMGAVPGISLDAARDRLRPEDRVAIAGQLGRIMQRFHSRSMANAPQLRSARGGWQALCRGHRARLCQDLQQLDDWPPRLVQEVRAFVTSAEVAAYLAAPGVLLHGDLTCYHVYIEQRAGRWQVAGLIDLGNTLVAPPEYEWMDLWLQTCEREASALRAFFSAYEPGLVLDEAYRRRLLGIFLHGWEAIPQLRAHMEAEGVAPMADLQGLLDWLWPPSLEVG